jgi:hypothetical protein
VCILLLAVKLVEVRKKDLVDSFTLFQICAARITGGSGGGGGGKGRKNITKSCSSLNLLPSVPHESISCELKTF